ncbi:MAG: (AJ250023) putative polyketide synthase [uncultured Sphingomonas sp.]|uniref:(AJ250023) putative polyketide synthase n=1 Tax=uncultured Sphingomonas sp. TaxID=158754 RepID=A0A6J4TFC9_9SPHN|nr:NADPH-dependent F420 reductase [uncultured Sphingomonas sp.]CAA9521212.1 MAG: (AJ250023) putative polyketide synthase [uncultured Sphingomonas sp.]
MLQSSIYARKATFYFLAKASGILRPHILKVSVMKIGIIGAGNIGGALAHRFVAAGHEVTIANSRGPASLQELAAETGARAGTAQEAARGNEVVVVTIPLHRIPDLPAGLFADAPADLVVIDTSNYYPQQRDGMLDGIEDGGTESGWVEKHLGRPVVKAFNSILADHLQNGGKPAGTPGRIALAVAGDDPTAKATAMALIDGIGFDTVDAGGIADSWRQQPDTPGYLKDYDVAGVRRALAEATPERKPEWRATPNSPGSFEQPA